MANNLLNLTSCYIKNCKKEVEDIKNSRTKYLKNSTAIYDKYIDRKIDRKTFISQINKIEEDFIKSIENYSMKKCEIDNCSKLVKIKLDRLAAKINYPIKKNYTVDDYIEIIILNDRIYE